MAQEISTVAMVNSALHVFPVKAAMLYLLQAYGGTSRHLALGWLELFP